WFRNRWHYQQGEVYKPVIEYIDQKSVRIKHHITGEYSLYFQQAEEVLFTENETNFEKLFDRPNESPFVKDAFHDAIIEGKNRQALRDKKSGTKCSPVY